MKYDGIRIMMRAYNLKYVDTIRNKLDKNKPLQVTIEIKSCWFYQPKNNKLAILKVTLKICILKIKVIFIIY